MSTTAEIDFVEVRLLREALEGVVSRALVTPILFEALEPYGNMLPTGAEGLLDMVRGPLAEVVSRRIGGVESDEVVRRAERLIVAARGGLESTRQPITNPAAARQQQHANDSSARAAASASVAAAARRAISTAPPAVPRDAPPPPAIGRERDATALVPTTREAVSVLVVASGGGLALRLSAALGSRRVAPSVVASLAALRDHLDHHGPPNILLVDATDFPPIPPDALGVALRRGPSTMVRAIWGADLPYGRGLVAAVGDSQLPVLALERGHGVDPLLDLIRSRRS